MAEGTVAIAGCVGCLVLTLIILLLVSMKGLNATTYALKKNVFNGKIDYENIYHGGRHVIGFWNQWIEFPGTIQSLEWLEAMPLRDVTSDLSPMLMRTQDGLMVNLGIVVQYQITRDSIPLMYQEFKDNYENFFISQIRSGFQDILARHPSEHLWVRRHELAVEFQNECTAICRDPNKIRGFILCWGVQLTGAHIDDDIEDKIIERQVQVQEQDYYRTRRQAALIRAITEVNESSYDKNITIARAQAGAQAFIVRNNASTDAAYNMSRAKANALSTIHRVVNAAGSMDALHIIRYQERSAMIEKTNTDLAYGEFQSVRLSIQPPPVSAPAPDPGHRRLADDMPEFSGGNIEQLKPVLQPTAPLSMAGRSDL